MAKQQQQQDARLVAVMGETGAGKSSFINAVLGKEAALVSDGTFSCTRSVEQFQYKRKDGVTVTLVDTPGFNDYGEDDSKTDAEILQMIAQFLKTQYDEKRKFSGIVFLHAITQGAAGSTAKNMRMFKRLCGSGDQLKNVVVVTTRWDEVCHSKEALDEAENSENSLMDSEGYLKELNDAEVPFLRAGHFSEATPQPAGDKYQSPLAVVERLLGLEPVYLQIQEEMAEGKPIQETAAGLVLAKEFEDLKNTLNERMDKIQRTVEDLESATDLGKTERDKQNEILRMRIKEWEKLQGEFSTQWKAWEECQKSLIASNFESFKLKQEQELKNARSEMREAHAKLNNHGLSIQQLNTELKQALETSRKERDVLSVECQTHRERERKLNDDLNETRSALTQQTLDLQADKVKLLEALNEAKSALAAKAAEVEIMKKESGSVNIPGLRAQVEEVIKDRDRVKSSLAAKTAEVETVKQNASLTISGLRAQLEEVKKDRDRATATHLSTQSELERTKKALQESREESEVLAEELEEKVGETDVLQKQVVEQASKIAAYLERITALEEEVKTLKSRRPRPEIGKGARRPNATSYTPGLDFIYPGPASPPSPSSPPSFLAPEVQRRASVQYGRQEAKSPPPPYVNASEQALADARERVTQIGHDLDTNRYLHNKAALQQEYNYLLTERIPQLEQQVLERKSAYGSGMPQPHSVWRLP